MPVSRPRALSLSAGASAGASAGDPGGAVSVSCEVAVWLKVEVNMAERVSRKEGSDEEISGDQDMGSGS